MSRVQLTLPYPVERALRQAALDSKQRPSQIVEDLIVRHIIRAGANDVGPLEMKVCPHCACEMPVKCRRCPDCQQEMS